MAEAKSWVSKTDMVRYVRCPYAFWLVDSGQVKLEDAISPLAANLMAAGIAFQQDVEAAAAPLPLPPSDMSSLFERTDLVLTGPLPLFMNRDLRIRGVPAARATRPPRDIVGRPA